MGTCICFRCQLTDTDEDLLSVMLMRKEKKEEATAGSAPEDAETKNGRLRGCPQPQRVNGVPSMTHTNAAHRARVSSMLGRGPCCSTAGLGLYGDDCPCPRGCRERAVYR